MKSLSLFSFLLVLGHCYGEMSCYWGDSLAITKTCPGVFESSEKSYCCIDIEGKPKCCTFMEFALTYIIIAVVVLVVLSVVCSIVCCICCPCCFIYKRRHGNII